jgi:hypothetical protein
MVAIDRDARKGYEAFRMSTLGQKQTCAVQRRMSALPPKADIDASIRSPRLHEPARWVGFQGREPLQFSR